MHTLVEAALMHEGRLPGWGLALPWVYTCASLCACCVHVYAWVLNYYLRRKDGLNLCRWGHTCGGVVALIRSLTVTVPGPNLLTKVALSCVVVMYVLL